LLANDLSRPVPPIRALAVVQNKVLIEAFRSLFARARWTPEEPQRVIAWELNRLKSPIARH
jgi:hypothetical protein